jgi:tetratricopeptide (TPR) repeat protein
MRPKSAVVHGRRGLAYLKMNKLDDALKDFDAALDISSRQALSLYGRGIIKLRKGDTTGGNDDINDAKKARAAIADEYVKYGVQIDAIKTAAPPPSTPSSTPAATSDCSRAETHWKTAEDIKSIAIYEDHLKRFPDCDFATLAKARIEALKK